MIKKEGFYTLSLSLTHTHKHTHFSRTRACIQPAFARAPSFPLIFVEQKIQGFITLIRTCWYRSCVQQKRRPKRRQLRQPRPTSPLPPRYACNMLKQEEGGREGGREGGKESGKEHVLCVFVLVCRLLLIVCCSSSLHFYLIVRKL
jgi:hypothetical protein